MNVRFHLSDHRCLSSDLPAEFWPPIKGHRMPSIGHDMIVFCAEGDLWKGSRVRWCRTVLPRIRARNPSRASPDGQTIAFLAQYEGPTEVYTMPVAQGVSPRGARRTCRSPAGRSAAS